MDKKLIWRPGSVGGTQCSLSSSLAIYISYIDSIKPITIRMDEKSGLVSENVFGPLIFAVQYASLLIIEVFSGNQ